MSCMWVPLSVEAAQAPRRSRSSELPQPRESLALKLESHPVVDMALLRAALCHGRQSEVTNPALPRSTFLLGTCTRIRLHMCACTNTGTHACVHTCAHTIRISTCWQRTARGPRLNNTSFYFYKHRDSEKIVWTQKRFTSPAWL